MSATATPAFDRVAYSVAYRVALELVVGAADGADLVRLRREVERRVNPHGCATIAAAVDDVFAGRRPRELPPVLTWICQNQDTSI